MTTSTAQAAPAAWYFTFQGVKQGPVTSAQLRTMAAEGKIAPADLVWKDGLPDWIPAAKVRGLFQNAAVPTANSHANPANPPQWRDAGGDATGGVIPYKNPPALIAYYLGILALLPALGMIFGLIALVLGITGLRRRARTPQVRGAVHAWIGIILGGGSLAVHTALIVLFVMAGMHS